MHIFIGGAYNGKVAYVQHMLEREGLTDAVWCDGVLPEPSFVSSVFVIHNLERFIVQGDLDDEVQAATTVFEQLSALATNNRVFVIVTDMGRGIVPIEPHDRKLRDVCGRLYQLLFQESEQVTRIWYGLAQALK